MLWGKLGCEGFGLDELGACGASREAKEMHVDVVPVAGRKLI